VHEVARTDFVASVTRIGSVARQKFNCIFNKNPNLMTTEMGDKFI